MSLDDRSQKNQRKPTQTQGELTKSTQKGPAQNQTKDLLAVGTQILLLFQQMYFMIHFVAVNRHCTQAVFTDQNNYYRNFIEVYIVQHPQLLINSVTLKIMGLPAEE